MASIRLLEPQTSRMSPPSAVAWIDDQQAIVARMDSDGRISTCEIERGGERELPYLSLVVHAIGDRQRVVILGPNRARLALERHYVARFLRPDRLVDVEPARAADRFELIDRLRALAV